MSILDKLKKKLAKTHNSFVKRIAEVIRLSGKVNEDLIQEIEDILIQADLGVNITSKIIEELEEKIRLHKISSSDEIYSVLEKIIIDILEMEYKDTSGIDYLPDQKPYVIMFVGVNGTGKTTTIAKVAHQYLANGNSVLLVAADTFRAAAHKQLDIWAKNVGADIIGSKHGADPASVVYSALTSAQAKEFDVVLIDTAGRLHTKVNLMKELEKINRTADKVIKNSPHETYLVIDATTGQNGIQQARNFVKPLSISGVILTKLDGTAKGGVAIGIKDKLDIPVKAICTGEQVDDIRQFDAKNFVRAIFED